MHEELTNYLLDELFPAFEALETQSAAILLLLKDKNIATEKDLAPYLDQAGNTASVKWRAARARAEHLLEAAFHPPAKSTDQIAKPKPESGTAPKEETQSASAPSSSSSRKEEKKSEDAKQDTAAKEKSPTTEKSVSREQHQSASPTDIKPEQAPAQTNEVSNANSEDQTHVSEGNKDNENKKEEQSKAATAKKSS